MNKLKNKSNIFNFYLKRKIPNHDLRRISIQRISVAQLSHFPGEYFLFNLHLTIIKFGLIVSSPCLLFTEVINFLIAIKSAENLKLLWSETWYKSFSRFYFYRLTYIIKKQVLKFSSPLSFLEIQINNVLL